MAAADTLYEVMTLMVKKGPLSEMGAPKQETIEL
jgi:agmatinase